MATAREVLALIITADAKGAIAEINKTGAAAKASITDADKAVKGFSANQMIAGGAVAAAFGGGALLGLSKLSGAYVDAGRETLKLQRVTGGSAEQMSRLRFVAQQSGIGVDQLSTAFVRLGKNANTKAGQDELAKLGVSVKDAAGNARPAVDVFGDISTAIAALPGGFDKSNAAVKLFGRSGADLLPILNRGGAGIAELEKQADSLGLTLSQKNVNAVRQYIQSQRELNSAVGALKLQLGEAVFPAFASALENVTSAVEGATKAFAGLPDEVKGTAGSFAVLGSAGLVVAGGVAIAVGIARKMGGAFTDTEGALTRTGTAMRTLGTIAAGFAIAEVVTQAGNSIGGFADNVEQDINRVIASTKGGQVSIKDLAGAFLEEGKKLKVTDLFSTIGASLEIGGLKNIQIPGSDKAIPSSDAQAVVDKLKAQSPEQTKVVLQAWQQQNDGLDHNSDAYKRNAEFIRDNLTAIDTAAAAQDALKASTDGLTSGENDQTAAIAATLPELASQAAAYYQTGNAAAGAVSPIKAYADALKAQTDPIIGVLDANQALADAQKRYAEISSGSTSEVLSATKNLAEAQQRLNDVLKDDPMFGLKSVSPEQELADARNRLADANRKLAANPNDPFAATEKDLAISDLEAASKRAQDEKRNASQRARQLRDAQQGVLDAQGQVKEAKSKSGPASEEAKRAALEVLKADMQVQQADLNLADSMKTNGVAGVQALNGELDKMADKGLISRDAANQLKGALQGAAGQAGALMLYLAGVNQQLDTFSKGYVQNGGKLFGVDANGNRTQVQGPVQNPASGGKGKRSPQYNIDGTRLNSPLPGYPVDQGPTTEALLEKQLNFDVNGNGIIGRALGGRVNARQPYLVGERRAELFMSDTSGYILPDLNRLGGGPSKPVEPITINATIVQHTSAPETSGAAVVQALRGVAYRAGKGIRVPVS